MESRRHSGFDCQNQQSSPLKYIHPRCFCDGDFFIFIFFKKYVSAAKHIYIMLYSEFRKQQEEEMNALLIERFKEIDHFRKLNTTSWGQPDRYLDDIQSLEKVYSEKVNSLREKQVKDKEDFLHKLKRQEHVSGNSEAKNPVDDSVIPDKYASKEKSKRPSYYRKRK